MNNEIFANVTEQAKTFVAPAQKLNKLALENTEKFAAMQLASLQTYTDLGINRWKAALEVRDVTGLQGYVKGYSDFLKVVSEQVVADSKAVAELGGDFTAEARKITEAGVAAVSAKAA